MDLNEEAVQVIRDIAEQLTGSVPYSVPSIGGVDVPFILVRDANGEVRPYDMSPLMTKPQTFKVGESFIEKESFVDYYKRFGTNASLIKACVDSKTVHASLDYGTSCNPLPRTHSCTLSMKPTEDYSKWCSAHRKWISQAEFAELLQDLRHTVIEPSSADLIEVATKLMLTKNCVVGGSIDLTSSSFSINFAEDVERKIKGSKLTVPNRFFISVQPWYGTDNADLEVELRTSDSGGRVQFMLVIQNKDTLERSAFDSIVEYIAAETGAFVYMQ